MDSGLRLTVIFESYKYDLDKRLFKEPNLQQRLVLNPILWPLRGLRLRLSLITIFIALLLEAFFIELQENI